MSTELLITAAVVCGSFLLNKRWFWMSSLLIGVVASSIGFVIFLCMLQFMYAIAAMFIGYLCAIVYSAIDEVK